MIWDFIIEKIATILSWFISLFPDANAGVLSEIGSGLTPIKNYLSTAGWIFPVSQFFTVLSIILVTESALFTIKVIHWIIKNISAGFIK